MDVSANLSMSEVILDINISTNEKSEYLITLLKNMDTLSNSNINDLCESYMLISSLSKKIGLNEDENKLNAYMLGIMKSIYEIAYDMSEKRDKEKDLNNMMSISKYLKPIVDQLYDNGSMTHKELAVALNISKSSLSNTLDRFEKYDIIDVTKYGRTNYYSLTNKGLNLLSHISNFEISKQRSAEDYTKLFVNFINELSKAIKNEDFNLSSFINEFADERSYFTSTKSVMNSITKLFETLRGTNKQRSKEIYITYDYNHTPKYESTILSLQDDIFSKSYQDNNSFSIDSLMRKQTLAPKFEDVQRRIDNISDEIKLYKTISRK